jgi:hypothetical protein
MAPASCRHSILLGAYILDALDPAEAAGMRAHMVHCRDCRQELGEFAEAKDMLERMPLAALLDSLPNGGQLMTSA